MNSNQMNNFNNNFSSSDINSNNTIDPNQNIQNDYYNNDAYYNNSNYETNNYSDTTYEEKEKKNGIWWKILLIILVLLIIIILLLKFCTGGKSNDEKYTELKKTICNAAEEYLNNNSTLLDRTTPGKTVIIKLSTLADANLIDAKIENPYYNGGLFKHGTEEKYFSLDNSVRMRVNNDTSLYCEIVDNAMDTTAPELTLKGDVEMTLAVGTEFQDPGSEATDDFDGDISDKIVVSGTVDYSKAGEYTLTYTVSDSAGNTTIKQRKVIYEEYANLDVTLGSIIDGVTPMISLKGSNPYCMVKGTQYVEPGAKATDNVDGDITDRIAVTNKVTGNLMGAFRVVYKVEDSAGNQAIAYRAVIVTTECPEETNVEIVPNNAPVITLVGKSSVVVEKGTEYIDLGATAYDKEDGDITSKIITDTTAVNTNVPNVYKVHYRVTDTAGELATAIRTVTVVESVTGQPSVRFTENKKNISVEVGKGSNSLISAPKAVNESGVAVTVNTTIEDYVTKVAVSAIDWNKVGKYRVTYTAVHGNGTIKQTKSIVVTITEAPLTIGGKEVVVVTKRDENCDLTESDLIKGGVTFTSGAIVSISAPDRLVCTIGTYEATVTATTNEKQSISKKLTIQVVDGNSTLDTTAPGIVTITGNTANPTDVYNVSGKWVGGAVSGITLTFQTTIAANTELSKFEWSKNCSDVDGEIEKTSSTAGSYTWKEAGKNSVCIRAVTTAGSKGPWSKAVNLYYDNVGPTVEFTHTWADGENDWHNTALTLTYNAKDEGSGLDHFEYTYDDVKAKKAEEIVTYNEASGKLTVSEGTEPTRPKLYVYVRAVDKAGNTGEWTANPAYANIDTIKPYTPTLIVEGNGTSVVKLKANFTDAPSIRPSGFGKLIYKVDDGEDKEEKTQTITAPSNTTTENVTQNIKVWAVDKAGNKSDLYVEENVTVAPMKTKATGVKLTNNGTAITDGAACKSETTYVGNTFTLVATPVPADSDEKTVTWSSSNASVATVDENGKIVVKATGSTTITAKIGDVSTTCKIDSVSQASSGSSSGSSSSNGSSSGSSSSDSTMKTCYCADNYSCKVSSIGQKTEYDCKMSCRTGTPGWGYKPALSKSCDSSSENTTEKQYSCIKYSGSCKCKYSTGQSTTTCSAKGTACQCPSGYTRSGCGTSNGMIYCNCVKTNYAYVDGTCSATAGCSCSKGSIYSNNCNRSEITVSSCSNCGGTCIEK